MKIPPNKKEFWVCTILFALMSIIGYCQSDPVSHAVRVPDQVKVGNSFNLDVIFAVQPQWYIYAPTGLNSAKGMIETKVILQLPDGIKRADKMRLPQATFKNGYEVYEGANIVMSQSLQSSLSMKPGTYEIKSKIIWQTCNNEICLPPRTVETSKTIIVK